MDKSLYGSKAFSNALAAMLGSGAIHVERLILKNLYCRLGLRWEQKKDFEFTDYMEELNRTDYAMTRLAEPRSERFYRMLLESTSDLIWVIDREGRYLYINGPLEKQIGLTNEETQGKTYGDIHTVDNTADFMAKVEQVFEGETISDEFPSSKDNRWFLRTMGPIRNESGEIEAVSIISKDITERKHAEKVITESEKKYRQLTEFLHERARSAILKEESEKAKQEEKDSESS